MSTPEQEDATRSDTLQGWKDIASYLGRSVRAVQRWEQELDLPVHRIQATTGQTVYALRTEIDDWRKSRDLSKALPEEEEYEGDGIGGESANGAPAPAAEPEPEKRAHGIWLGFAVAVVAVLLIGLGAAIGVFVIAKRTGPASSIQFAGASVVAYDSFGRVVWTHGFGRQVSNTSAPPQTWGSRIWGAVHDGQLEFIVPIRFAREGQTAPDSDALVAFDGRGNVLWTVQPNRKIRCGPDVFDGPWRIYAVHQSTGPGPQRVWVAFNHSTWWPGFVLEVDAKGQSQFRMLNTGWIYDLAEWRTQSGAFLAVSGVNNELVRPSLTLIDLDGKPTMSPHTDPRFSCEAAPEASPRRVYLFPVLDTGRPDSAFARQATVLASALKVQIYNQGGTAIAEIHDDLVVTDFSMSDGYWAVHRELEIDGSIHHSAQSCPERTRPQPIEEWTAATGWKHFTIVPTVRQPRAKK